MSNWRIAFFTYLAFGAVFILRHSRAWWEETEVNVHRLQHQNFWPPVLIALLCLVSLVLDVVLWPRSAWIGWKNARKLRHGDSDE